MKRNKIVGKWLLATSLSAAMIGGGLTLPVHPVAANVLAQQVEDGQVAKEFLSFVKDQKWNEIYQLFNGNLQKYYSKEEVPQIFQGLTATFGNIQTFNVQSNVNNGIHNKVTILVTAEQGPFSFVVNVDKNGKIEDFHTEMATDPNQFSNPSYNHPENYSEKQIQVGEGEFALPGILTVPKGEGPFPVVVLVHGSGPNDMDETAYGFKPFRDIAVGLANKGVAVLRYDKRTNTHALKTSKDPKFSIMEETVLDANLAVSALKSVPEVDTKNIYVLGHSQGGYALPLILDNDKNHEIKGAIGVAGPTGKFHELLLWQMEQSIKRAEGMKAPQEQIDQAKMELEVYKSQFSMLDNPNYNKDHIPAEFQLQPAYWWFDLRDYQPSELIQKQDTPLLFLQGNKDIQVPAEQLENWKTALKGHDNAQFLSYPDMMHFLVNIKGEANGVTEYSTPGNVAPELIDDVATWVKTGSLEEKEHVDLSIFKDYKKDAYWSEAFEWAVNHGIIKGFAKEQLLKPNQPMTESQYLNVFLRYTLGQDLKDESVKNLYTLAKSYELPVTGKSNHVVTRGEAAILLVKSFTEKKMTEKEAIQWLYDHQIVNGYTDKKGNNPKNYESYQAKKPITRADLVTMFYRVQNM
ncbi:S-layer homology domain-containing protein [Heyndrickxia oleronia]|uniref:S-layer homology domain-containing protein n=1 Tax=Heyndrickxia oleronia TaxID=38875 RepID=UPI002040BCCF|nr:S-layer homology domain-containing protein [Heyndrickxia oleronia]